MINRLSTNAVIDPSFSESTTWDSSWKQHFLKYQGDIRHAYYVAAVRQRQERRLLEIAAGSFRDMVALNRWGLSCEGVDFSGESIEKARAMVPAFSDRIKRMDAASLDYPDGAFDLSYHAGFWVYFDDTQIARFAAEQARVTKSRMIATVHNAQHVAFRERLAALGQKDPFYRVRFFYPDEIVSLMQPFCRRVILMPAMTGGEMDRLIHVGLGPGAFRWAYRLYRRFERLEASERLMCIGEL